MINVTWPSQPINAHLAVGGHMTNRWESELTRMLLRRVNMMPPQVMHLNSAADSNETGDIDCKHIQSCCIYNRKYHLTNVYRGRCWLIHIKKHDNWILLSSTCLSMSMHSHWNTHFAFFAVFMFLISKTAISEPNLFYVTETIVTLQWFFSPLVYIQQSQKYDNTLAHKINIKPISTGTGHTSAKARLTSVAIRKHVLDRVHTGAT